METGFPVSPNFLKFFIDIRLGRRITFLEQSSFIFIAPYIDLRVDQITPFSIDIYEKLRISQLAEYFYAIYGPRKSITVHECPTLDAILSQMTPLHALMTNLRAVLILYSFLRFGLVGRPFSLGFPTNTLYTFRFSQYLSHAWPVLF
jgi:hypothetical protein